MAINKKEIINKLKKSADQDKNISATFAHELIGDDEKLFLEIENILDEDDYIIVEDEHEHDHDDEAEMVEIEIETLIVDKDEPNTDDLAELESEDFFADDVFQLSDESEANINHNDPVKQYLKEIGDIPMINVKDEIRLAGLISAGKAASEQLESVRLGLVELSEEDIFELENIEFKGLNARNKLIDANYRLVVANARKHLNRGLPLLDLISEGNIGLLKAAEKFDVERGYKFSTYATWWIRQAITRAAADQARTIRIPVHMVENIQKMIKTQKQLIQELGREPLIEEVADKMGLSVEKIQFIQRVAREPISLEKPVGEEEDSTLGDFISDPNSKSPYQYLNEELKKQTLNEILNTLTEREAEVLKLRHGIEDGKTYTFEEIGAMFGLSRERIRQIESKAMRKIRNSPAKLAALKELLNN